MPIDLDEIRKGRRRDWDKLQDPEVRRQREREKKKADPEYKKKRSKFQRRDDALEEKEVKDLEEWRKTKKRVGIIIGAFVMVLMVSWGSNILMAYIQSKGRADKIVELNRVVEQGIAYKSFDNPVEAWASWRSAWREKDAEAIFTAYSPFVMDKIQGDTATGTYIRQYQSRIDRGTEARDQYIASKFDNPEIVHYPVFNLREGSLAVFKHEIRMPPEFGGKTEVYYLVMSWDKENELWKIEDVRHELVWREAWKSRTQIPRTRNPNQISE